MVILVINMIYQECIVPLCVGYLIFCLCSTLLNFLLSFVCLSLLYFKKSSVLFVTQYVLISRKYLLLIPDTYPEKWREQQNISVERSSTQSTANISNGDENINQNHSNKIISNVLQEDKTDLYRLEIKNEVEEIVRHGEKKYVRRIPAMRHIAFAFHHQNTTRRFLTSDAVEECIPNSSEDFPEDVFTMEEKRNGAIVLHFIFGIYCFTLLAVVCNDYFLPSVERICEVMQLSEVCRNILYIY